MISKLTADMAIFDDLLKSANGRLDINQMNSIEILKSNFTKYIESSKTVNKMSDGLRKEKTFQRSSREGLEFGSYKFTRDDLDQSTTRDYFPLPRSRHSLTSLESRSQNSILKKLESSPQQKKRESSLKPRRKSILKKEKLPARQRSENNRLSSAHKESSGDEGSTIDAILDTLSKGKVRSLCDKLSRRLSLNSLDAKSEARSENNKAKLLHERLAEYRPGRVCVCSKRNEYSEPYIIPC